MRDRKKETLSPDEKDLEHHIESRITNIELKQPEFIRDPISGESVRTSFLFREPTLEDIQHLSKAGFGDAKTVIDHAIQFISSAQLEGVVNEVLAKESIENWKGVKRKTQVVTKRSMRALKRLAREYQTSRDMVLMVAITVLRVSFDDLEKKRLSNHREALDILKKFCLAGYKVEEQIGNRLGEDDPITYRVNCVMASLERLIHAIQSELKDGTPIDPDGI